MREVHPTFFEQQKIIAQFFARRALSLLGAVFRPFVAVGDFFVYLSRHWEPKVIGNPPPWP